MSNERAVRAARNHGEGAACVSNERNNPYDAETQSELHQAWNEGWDRTKENLGQIDR